MMDISEFLSSDSRKNIDAAMSIYEKTNKFGSKFHEIRKNTDGEISIDTIEGYVELFEPLVDEKLREKAKDLKKLFNMLRIMKLFDKKKNLEESDIFKMIEPFVEDDQKEMAQKFIQIVKALGSIDNKEAVEENSDITVDEKNKLK